MTTTELERIGFRGALSLSCRDAVSGVVVADGLTASTWPASDPAARLVASRSAVSGLLGFGAVPALRDQQWARSSGGAPLVWPASPAPDPYVVHVVDTRRRYLPVVTLVDVPVAGPTEIALHSAPARAAASGWAVIRGEVHDRSTGSGVGWPVVTVETGPDAYEVVADHLGRFLLIAPYPEALPPLVGSPPAGPGLGAMTWPLTVTVRSGPSTLAAAPGTDSASTIRDPDPPELSTILGQPTAQQEIAGVLQTDSSATLAFGTHLVLTLPIQPA